MDDFVLVPRSIDAAGPGAEKGYMIGEFKFNIRIPESQAGEMITTEVYVPWTTIKEIRKRLLEFYTEFPIAALAQPPLRDAPEDWKKIESAPKDGVPFDAWAIAGPGDNGFRVANCWTDETGVRIPAGTMFNPFCTITHWRPIPSGPKERE